jgi:hypothetical protein
MRNIILGTIAGLLIGAAGALGYSQLAGDGNALADLQSKLNDVNAKLAKAQADEKFLKEQNNSESAQLDEVLKSKQAGATTDAGAAAAAPAGNPLTIGGTTITPDMIRGFMAMMGRGPGGGFRSPEQRAFLLQARLKLTPDQAKAIKDAMDADQKARRDAYRAARQNGGQVDPAALAAANSLDKTMASVLSPSQQVQYQQVQSDEKQARAESQATQQVDNMMPLLQLSDDQKSKLMNSLYQQQLSAPDMGGPGAPGGFGGGPGGGGGNPLAALAQQGQAVSAAMKSVLSPDQYALYQQNEQVQQQTMANFGGGQNGGGRRNRQNGQNGGTDTGGGAGGGQAPAPVAGAADAGATSGTTTATGTSTTTGTTTATGTTTDSTSTTTPSATTNAASGTPPAN